MIEERLSRLILEGVERAAGELGLEKIPDEVELDRPPRKELGDFTTNVALQLASQARDVPPRAIASAIVERLPESDFVSSVEVAGAGFINFRVRHEWLYDVLRQVVTDSDRYGRGEPTGLRVQVENVSANP